MNYYKLFCYITSMFFVFSCNGKETERIKLLESIKIDLIEK